MSYIVSWQRVPIEERLLPLLGLPLQTAGEFNYVITRLVDTWLGTSLSYHNIALITGVLENVKQELYRRLAIPYEDQKIVSNGDVYYPRDF